MLERKDYYKISCLTSVSTPTQNAFSQFLIFRSGRVHWQPVIHWPLGFGRVRRDVRGA